MYLFIFLKSLKIFSHCFRNWDCFGKENTLEEEMQHMENIPVSCPCLWLHRWQGGESASFGYMSRKELTTRAKGTQDLANLVHPRTSVIVIWKAP